MIRIVRVLKLALAALTAFALTGCWDRMELPERAFVMGAALDADDSGRFVLTVQVYKPSQSVGPQGSKSGNSFVNIRTVDNSLTEAIRDIPIHLGRKAQWSHMRIILIGEELARKHGLKETLDFFYRDHEPRLTTTLTVTEGKAADYLEVKPLIERTVSQQLFQSQKSTAANSSKAPGMNLYRLALQLKGQVGDAYIPYMYMDGSGMSNEPNAAGAAMVKKGVMVDVLPPNLVEGLLMLLNEYKGGIIEIECPSDKKKQGKAAFDYKESVEAQRLTSKIEPKPKGDHLDVDIRLHLRAAVTELRCTQLDTMDKERKFADRIANEITGIVEELVDRLKKEKVDVLDIGNRIYTKNPALWKRWKDDWDDIFASARFHVKTEVEIINTGTEVGKQLYPSS